MTHLIYGIDVRSFIKACTTFERFRKNLTTEQEKAGAIQSFEFAYELAWKTMKRLLQTQGIEAQSPRACFREAAAIGMISDPKQWFLFIEKRNLTVHTYQATIVDEIIAVFDLFSQSLHELMAYIENESS